MKTSFFQRPKKIDFLSRLQKAIYRKPKKLPFLIYLKKEVFVKRKIASLWRKDKKFFGNRKDRFLMGPEKAIFR